MPFIVLIEIIRNVIRPLTISVRLVANIIAGHLLLTLIGSIRAHIGYLLTFFLIVGIITLTILELGVGLIQSFVFSTLITLYVREVNSKALNSVKN